MYVASTAKVDLNALVRGDAQVRGDGLIVSSADFIVIGPAISRGRYTTAHVDTQIGVRVNCGCFTGTVAEFGRQINKVHKDDPAALLQYLAFVSLINAHFKARELLLAKEAQ